MIREDTKLGTLWWVVEEKFNTDKFEVHSLHKHRADAKDKGQEIFDSFTFDRDGDGVRVRRGEVTKDGIDVRDRVFWMQMCKVSTLQDIIKENDPIEDYEEEYEEQDVDFIYYD